MKTSDLIKKSLDACDRRDLDEAIHWACIALDGTATKMYPSIYSTGERFKKFIVDHIDIIELMFGGIDLRETVFPLKDRKGNIGLRFEEMMYEKIRCPTAHGSELPDGYGIKFKIQDGIHQFTIDIENNSMTLPESVIFALGLPCVLAPVNEHQRIGSDNYYFSDPNNRYIVDQWWGKAESARKVMDFTNQVRVKMDFTQFFS